MIFGILLLRLCELSPNIPSKSLVTKTLILLRAFVHIGILAEYFF
jgi:hypothetical protein